MLVTAPVLHPEISASKDVAPENKNDMSVTRLVSHVEILPYVAMAALGSLRYDATAIRSCSLAETTNVVSSVNTNPEST